MTVILVRSGAHGAGCDCEKNLEVIEVVADFGVGPVGVADDLAADKALSVDDVGLGPAVGAVKLGYFLVGVAHGVEIDMESSKEAAVGAGVFVDADGQDGDVGAIVLELHECRRLLDAGRALAPPEVQQDDFASVIGEADGVFAVAHGEVGSHSVGIRWDCSPVAGCGADEHE
jgi:hypothetical protein